MLKIWGKKRINRYAIMIAESNFSFVELFIPFLSFFQFVPTDKTR